MTNIPRIDTAQKAIAFLKREQANNPDGRLPSTLPLFDYEYEALLDDCRKRFPSAISDVKYDKSFAGTPIEITQVQKPGEWIMRGPFDWQYAAVREEMMRRERERRYRAYGYRR